MHLFIPLIVLLLAHCSIAAFSPVFPPTSSLSFSRTGTAVSLAQNSDGTWVAFNSTQPRITTRGLYLEEQVTNLCENFNAAPTDLTGVITRNNTSISLADDTPALTAAGFGPALSSFVDLNGARVKVMNGKVLEIDASDSTSSKAYVIQGANKVPGTFVYSVYARKVSGSSNKFVKMGLDNQDGAEVYSNLTTYVRMTGRIELTGTGRAIYIKVDGGAVGRFILNQFEQVFDNDTTTSSPIVVSGANATRGADVATITLPSNSYKRVFITPFRNPPIVRSRPANNRLVLQAELKEPWYASYIQNISLVDDESELPFTNQTIFVNTAFTRRWRGQPMDRSSLQQTFRDDFNRDTITDKTGSGPWYSQVTHSSIGDAYFYQKSRSNDSYAVVDGHLRCRGYTNSNDRWQSCIVQTVNASGYGHQQKYGVWEMRGKVPAGDGVWPAFWPYSVFRYTRPDSPRGEFDIFEFYTDGGTTNRQIHCALNLWKMQDGDYNPEDYDDGHIAKSSIVDLGIDITLDYHTFAGEITPDWIIWYVDNIEVTRIRAFKEWQENMYQQLCLQLRTGFKAQTPGPIDFLVDYVTTYQRVVPSTTSSSGTPTSSSGTPTSTSNAGTTATTSADTTDAPSSSTSSPTTSAPSTGAESTSHVLFPCFSLLMLSFCLFL